MKLSWPFADAMWRLPGDSLDVCARGLERLFDTWNLQPSQQFRMVLDKSLQVSSGGRLANGVSHVERIEIAVIDNRIHGVEADVISIDVKGLGPTQLTNGLLS